MTPPDPDPESAAPAPEAVPDPHDATTAQESDEIPGASGAGSERPEDGWSLIALVPHDGKEPPASVSEEMALAVWCAVSAIWHPSLLARARELPRIESIEAPTAPGPREVRVIAGDHGDRLPSGYRTQAEDAGTALVESGTDRAD